MESIKLTAAVDIFEGRDIISMYIPNTFIQTLMPVKDNGERVITKIRGTLVDCLVEIDPTAYIFLVVTGRGVKVLYLHILCTTCGILEESMLWYKKF